MEMLMLEFCCPGKQGSLLNCLGPDWKPVVRLGMSTRGNSEQGWKARQMAGGRALGARRWIRLLAHLTSLMHPHLCGEWAQAWPSEQEVVVREGPHIGS